MLTGPTDTIQVPFFVESAVDAAVMVTVPGERAETRPELLTVAMAVLPALQDTPCGAPEGETEAESCFVLPALTVALLGLTVTPVGATTFTPREKVPETEVLAPLTFRRYCVPEVKLRVIEKLFPAPPLSLVIRSVEPWYSSPAVSVDPSIETCEKAAP